MKYRYFKIYYLDQFREFIARKDINVINIEVTGSGDFVVYHVFYKEKGFKLFKKKEIPTIAPLSAGLRYKSYNKCDKRKRDEDGDYGHVKSKACDFAYGYAVDREDEEC